MIFSVTFILEFQCFKQKISIYSMFSNYLQNCDRILIIYIPRLWKGKYRKPIKQKINMPCSSILLHPKWKLHITIKRFFLSSTIFQNNFIFLAFNAFYVHMQCSMNLKIRWYSKIAMLALVIQSHTTQKWMSDTKKCKKVVKMEKIVHWVTFCL